MIFAWHYGKHKKTWYYYYKNYIIQTLQCVTLLVLFEQKGKHFCAEQEKDLFIIILYFIFLFIYTFLLLIKIHMQICNYNVITA